MMNRIFLAIACLTFLSSCSQQPVRPKPEDIEGMQVTSISGKPDYGYSLQELVLMRDRGKISMAGSAAVRNGVYDYRQGMTLRDFIMLTGGDIKCPSRHYIGVKRVIDENFFALGDIPPEGFLEPGDTVYFNCIRNSDN